MFIAGVNRSSSELMSAYGELAYGTNEEATVALSIRFDNMEQWGADKTSTSLEGGIGAAVGRQVATQAITGALGTQG